MKLEKEAGRRILFIICLNLVSNLMGNALWFYIRCGNCKEKIKIRINKKTDIQQDFERDSNFFLKKEILGENCPNLMEIEINFDSEFNITKASTQNCKIITKEEFENV